MPVPIHPIMLVDSRAISAAQFVARIKARGVVLVDLRSVPSQNDWAPTQLRRRLEHNFLEMPYLRVADIQMTDHGTIAVLRRSRTGADCLCIFAQQSPLALLYDTETMRHREALIRVLKKRGITPKLFQF